MVRKILGVLFFTAFQIAAFSQASEDYKIILPEKDSWDEVEEGGKFQFELSVQPQLDSVKFEMIAPQGYAMSLSEEGLFEWQTTDGLVTEEEEEMFFYVQFRAIKDSLLDSIFVELVVLDKTTQMTATMSNDEESPVLKKKKYPLERLVIPKKPGWNLVREGDSINFKIKTVNTQGEEVKVRYYLEEGEPSGISLDAGGNFQWVPAFDYVDRLQQTRDKHLFLIAEDEDGNSVSEKVVFTVFHKNQPPTVQALSPFYVLLGTKNYYEVSTSSVTDIDGDPIVFYVNKEDLPEGMEFSSSGKISWTPSRNQFYRLRNQPLTIPFFAEDQPAKERTAVFLSVEASSQDMPPDITIIPSETSFELNENERLQLVIHVSDANGDEDIEQFSFVSEDGSLDPELLRKNTDNQYEFIWMPGYDFVRDPDPEKEIELRFFAIDKTRKSSEKLIKIRVKDTEDLSKKDAQSYNIYKDMMLELLNLMDQLEYNQKELEKELKKAKRGKKNRAIMNASIGAVTGLSPVIAQNDAQKTISVIGGTSTLTLGTLEAKEVIGKSVNTINEKIKLNAELYNQYLSEGISFARRYNSKANRRNSNFSFDVEKLRKLLVNPKMATLELDAGWENKKDLSDKRLKSIFTEFDSDEN